MSEFLLKMLFRLKPIFEDKYNYSQRQKQHRLNMLAVAKKPQGISGSYHHIKIRTKNVSFASPPHLHSQPWSAFTN